MKLEVIKVKIVDEITKKTSFDEKMKNIDEVARLARKQVSSEYEKEPCNHNIIIKLYGSVCAKQNLEPDYICIGCEKNIYDEEQRLGKNILDFTDSCDGMGYMGSHNNLVA